GKNSLNRLIRCVCGKKIGPDPRNFNQRVSLGRNDLLIRTFPRDAVRVYLEDLYPDEGSKYIDKMVDKVASVAIPIAVHQKCSETYGGRNNRKVETESGEMITKKELDARDLEAAVNANWDANAECLKNEYGMSNEKIEEIRAKLHKLNRNVGLY
ncbi:hypothetical protein R1N68_06315, partial [Klebsiella sp. 72742]